MTSKIDDRLADEANFAAALAEYASYFDNPPEPGSESARRFVALGASLAQFERSMIAAIE